MTVYPVYLIQHCSCGYWWDHLFPESFIMTSPQRFWDSVTKRISVCSDDEHEANYTALQINMQSSNQSSTCKLRREADVCVCDVSGRLLCVWIRALWSSASSQMLGSPLMLSWSQHKHLWTLSVSHARFHVRVRDHIHTGEFTLSLSLFSSPSFSHLHYSTFPSVYWFHSINKIQTQTRASHHWVKVHTFYMDLYFQCSCIFPYQVHSCTAGGL